MKYIIQQTDCGVELECFGSREEAEEYVDKAVFEDAEEIARSLFSPGRKVDAIANEGRISISLYGNNVESALETLREELQKRGFRICGCNGGSCICEPTQKAFDYYEIVEA